MTLVSIVTGGAGAMGSACARSLASAVDAVLLTDCDARRLTAACGQLEAESGATLSSVVGDIADPGVVAELASRAAEVGEMHSLVHTAGVSPSMADWQDILRVDLVGVERLLDGLFGTVVPGSAAVCMASISGHMGAFEPEMDAVLDAPLLPDFVERFRSQFSEDPDPGTTYRLAKRGVIRSCERAAQVWARKGGRVVSLSPGLIDTEMGQLELVNHPMKEGMARLTPIRSTRQNPDAVLPGHVADVAAAAAFLCSEEAAFISGCDLRVDGGLVAAMRQPG